MDAVMLSVENLEPGLKAKYKQLAIFLDDVVIPTKVSSERISQGSKVSKKCAVVWESWDG